MKPLRILMVAFVLLAPIAARTLWFYRGVYEPAHVPNTPDFAEMTIPQPPLSTPEPEILPAQTPSKAVVVFDLNHNNRYTLAEIEPLVRNLDGLNASILKSDSDQPLSQQLKNADAYVVIAPTLPFSQQEIGTVERFVARGGRLLVVSDPTRRNDLYFFEGVIQIESTVEAANLLLSPFNIAFAKDYVYNLIENEGNFRHVLLQPALDDPLTSKLERVVFYSAHSLAASPKTILSGDENTLSSLTDFGGGLAVAASDLRGRVLAIGDLTFMTKPYHQVADNQRFVANIAEFLAGKRRSRSVTDFPYLFTQPVGILAPKESAIDKSLASFIGAVQRDLERINILTQVMSQPQTGYDLLVFGKYETASAELQEYLASFDLRFPESGDSLHAGTLSPTPSAERQTGLSSTEIMPENADNSSEPLAAGEIFVPRLGKLSTKQLGLLLFTPGAERNTLVLLAETDTALLELAGFFGTGTLDGCVIHDRVAVCPLLSSATEPIGFYPP